MHHWAHLQGQQALVLTSIGSAGAGVACTEPVDRNEEPGREHSTGSVVEGSDDGNPDNVMVQNDGVDEPVEHRSMTNGNGAVQ